MHSIAHRQFHSRYTLMADSVKNEEVTEGESWGKKQKSRKSLMSWERVINDLGTSISNKTINLGTLLYDRIQK